MTDQRPHTPTRIGLIAAWRRFNGLTLVQARDEVDRALAAAEQRGAIKALRDAANLSRTCWAANKNLIDPNDPEVSYSFDKWLEVHADRLEGNDD